MERLANALLVATMDTKSKEALFISDCLKKEGIKVTILDAGIKGRCPAPVDVTRENVARAGGRTLTEVQSIGHEGKAIEIMISGAIQLAQDLYRRDKIQGIIGLGGSMGTTLGTGVMRPFPVGFPKVMISTMASRDTRPFVGTKDILMLHSVCDIAGLNRISRRILCNGARALAGMLGHSSEDFSLQKPLIFLSTLGTTETCAQQIRANLEKNGEEVVTFHTNGSGGQAMEEMIDHEKVSVLVDLSLHEIADHLFGGDYDAGPARGWSALEKEIPTILVPGNIDFLVSGPIDAALQRFPDRAYHVHNAAITVVRTDRKEIKALASTIAKLCNQAKGLVKILIPMKGFSAFDHPQGPLPDPEAPYLFAESLKKNLEDASNLNMLPYHINDIDFAHILTAELDKWGWDME